MDHRNINLEVDFMKGKLASAENLAISIWQELEGEIAGWELPCIASGLKKQRTIWQNIWGSNTFILSEILLTMNDKNMNYEKVEEYDAATLEQLSFHYKEILRLIGENPDREGLQKTPMRVAKAIQFLTQGYDLDPVEVLSSAKFRETSRKW